MAQIVKCNKCGIKHDDADTLQMVKRWLEKDNYAPCPLLGCTGELRILDLYSCSYRGGEIEATVAATSEEEAINKFIAGDVEDQEVGYYSLHPDMVEVEKE